MPTDDGDDFYPGSTEVKRSSGGKGRVVPTTEPQPWEELGHQYVNNGRRVTLYPISALAMALERSPYTIRHWDQAGHLPPPNNYTDSHSEHGRRRLYTHAEISGLQQIAATEGLLFGKKVFVGKTNFRVRAQALLDELEDQ